VVDRIAPRALMIIAVENDATTPEDHSYAMYERAESPKRLVVQTGTTHYAAYAQYQSIVNPRIVEWFTRYLANGEVVIHEDAEDTAVREALEECGVALTRLEAVGSPFSSPGVSSERVDLFLAAYSAGDRKAGGGGVAGEHEHITVEEVPLALLWTWVEQRRIEDLKTLALILALRVRRPDLFPLEAR
jgi:8-oxo-dGTP pyrophosphatase MutT (NUDIX family)